MHKPHKKLHYNFPWQYNGMVVNVNSIDVDMFSFPFLDTETRTEVLYSYDDFIK